MDQTTAAVLGVSTLADLGLGIYQGINAKRLTDRFNAQKKASYLDTLDPI